MIYICTSGPSLFKTKDKVKEMVYFQMHCIKNREQLLQYKAAVSSFCSTKAAHILLVKSISILEFVCTRRLNESLSNDFIKLTMF